MTTVCQAFFIALGSYLSVFQSSPPHSFINDNTIPLQTKIVMMTDAVGKRNKIYVV